MIKPVKIFVMGVVLLYAGSFMFAADESVSEETESEVDEILLKQIGDIDDGSRAKTVHHFPLYDDQDFEIFPDSTEPFSTRQTCGKCHDYDTISRGWHFNAGLMDKPAGRRAQPWLYWDAAIGVQFPLSYRNWEGVFSPSEAGLTQWDFIRVFGRQLPGGMAGEKKVSNEIDPGDKWELSGMLEVNCLACHNASYRQDQSQQEKQIRLENFRWAITAASGLGVVEGNVKKLNPYWQPGDTQDTLPKVQYDSQNFFPGNEVFIDITESVDKSRCYYCHSNKDMNDQGTWVTDEDVHLKAGMTCTDCHRHGQDHMIVRGYEGESEFSENPLAKTTSCKECHMGEESAKGDFGRFAAPYPKHGGIPLVHFEKLTCTVCHSGPVPQESVYATKTSRAHGLGTHRANVFKESLPHVYNPVYARQPDGKIGVQKIFWPAYWGYMIENEITLIPPEKIKTLAGHLLYHPEEVPETADWPDFTDEQVIRVLALLSQENPGSTVVYVCGGKVHQLGGQGGLTSSQHAMAQAGSWPIAHNVRPARQAWGAKNCRECHSNDSPFFYAKVPVDSPLVAERSEMLPMNYFMDVDPTYISFFATGLAFRPALKVALVIVMIIVALVLLFFALRAIGAILKMVDISERQN